jgi:hypothetical protein
MTFPLRHALAARVGSHSYRPDTNGRIIGVAARAMNEENLRTRTPDVEIDILTI